MKKNLFNLFATVFVATAFAFSVTNAQNNTTETDFLGDVSVKIYCTFNQILPGGKSCDTNILVNDITTTQSSKVDETSGQAVFTENKAEQITQVINRTVNNPARVVYVQGPAGRDGRNGTTTIVYQTSIAGATNAGIAGYINAGSNGNSFNANYNPIQTTVPGEIWNTMVHNLGFGTAIGSNLFSVNINATNTNTVNLIANNATTGNLVATSTFNLATGTIGGAIINLASITQSTTTNAFIALASITNGTSTSWFSVFANLINLISTNATITNATTTNLVSENASTTNLLGTKATLTNATTTNLFSTNASVTNATATNIFANFASVTQSTSTDLFSVNASITNATTTNFFAAFANFLNMFVENLTFKSATGTNLQVANASTTNLVATGTFALATGTISSSTSWFANIANLWADNFLANKATLTEATTTNLFSTNASVTNATGTNLFSVNASITNATTTNFFAAFANFLNMFVENLTFKSATGTNLQVTNASTTNLVATGTFALATGTISSSTSWFANIANLWADNILANKATITEATTTNLFSTNASITNAAVNNLVVNNFTATGTSNVLGTTTMFGSLIPYASTTWMTLGSLANPWSELFVSSSSVYIGGLKISNVDGALAWNGNTVVTQNGTSSEISLATVNASTTNASTTNTLGLNAENATITNATTTNLFATLGNFVTGMFTNLFATNATITNATTNNLVTGMFTATGTTLLTNLTAGTTTLGSTTLGNAMLLDLIGLQATLTNVYSPSITGNSVSAANVVANMLTGINSAFTGLLFTNATGTRLTSNSIFVTNLTATGTASLADLFATNATIGNLTTSNISSDNADLVIGTVSTNPVSFIVGGADTLVLRATGDVSVANSLAVGRNTPNFLLHVGSPAAGSGVVARFSNVDGNCNVNPTGAGFTCSSDERLKKNFTDFSGDVLELIKKVTVKEYNMLKQADGTPKQVGYIAQNLETIFPWLVETDEEGFKSVSYGNMTPMLVLAVNELNKKVDVISDRILNVTEIVVNSLKARSVETDKIKTQELCFASDLCFTESDMREFKSYLDSKKSPNPVPVPPVLETVVEEDNSQEGGVESVQEGGQNEGSNTESIPGQTN